MHVIDVDRNLLLVRSVEKFPCLYNFTLPDYIKKEKTDIAWTEVSNETKLTGESRIFYDVPKVYQLGWVYVGSIFRGYLGIENV